MLTEKITHDAQVLEDGQIQMREITRIFRDGIEISKFYHRKVIDVGDDVSGEPEMVRQIASAIHTPDRVDAREAAKALRAL